MGRYDAMRGVGDGIPGERMIPYHPLQLADFSSTNWLVDSTITTSIRNFHIPQLRHPTQSKRKIYKVKPEPLSTNYFGQYFLLSNHQLSASSVFDLAYMGSGLLIWHILPTKAWDLESAAGELSDVHIGQPVHGAMEQLIPINPPHMGDALERHSCARGGASDFFDGSVNMTEFSATTNPTSNYYAANFDLHSPQTVISHIGVENIRDDLNSTDMIADIYVDPTQYVVSPNGGELLAAGNPLTVTWLRRQYAGIGTVNIAFSLNGGQTYAPLALGVPNTSNQYTMSDPLFAISSQARIQVTSFDATTNASDVSDANFTLWGIPEDATFQATITHRCVGTTPKVKVAVTYNTSIASDGDDELKVYTSSPCGTPVGTATVANPSHTPKTNHTIFWEGTCSFPANTVFYIVVKSQHGSAWASTTCRYVGTVTCISCGGVCNPPCELE
jgi:hypothetical protein